jgi:MoaA/NifB/PqqE/SkfB family radical SAM enzyme
MTWLQMVALMKSAYSRGFRDLYFTGGEPMLWRDGPWAIRDAVEMAKKLGFFHVHVYTNGTRGLEAPADLFWVGMDGLPDTFGTRRGNHFDQVETAIRDAHHRRIAVIYVIDRFTACGVEPFLRWVAGTRLPVIGVMFYFHTPYYGIDELYLAPEERRAVVSHLLGLIGEGLPVLNSPAGLRALASGNWPRRTAISSIADVGGEYVCCRTAGDETCRECGYAACAEIVEAQRLRPSALLGMARYW